MCVLGFDIYTWFNNPVARAFHTISNGAWITPLIYVFSID